MRCLLSHVNRPNTCAGPQIQDSGSSFVCPCKRDRMKLVVPGNGEEFVEDVHTIHFRLYILRLAQSYRTKRSGACSRIFLPRHKAASISLSESHGISVHSPNTSPTLLEATQLEAGERKVFCVQRKSALPLSLRPTATKAKRCCCKVLDDGMRAGGGPNQAM